MSGAHFSDDQPGFMEAKVVSLENRKSDGVNSLPGDINENLLPNKPLFHEDVLLKTGPELEGPISAQSDALDNVLGPAEFNRKLGMWFGEEGFIAMRSFFRASVLNSLQKSSADPKGGCCSDLDVVIIALITDFLVRKGKFFTLSVYTNEVLRPAVQSDPVLKSLMNRIGQDEIVGPALNPNDVERILTLLDLNQGSFLGSEILDKYFQKSSQDLFTIFFRLLRGNTGALLGKSTTTRNNDVVFAMSEGLRDEMGKIHKWFSDFNDQFTAVAIKLNKMLKVGKNRVTKAAQTGSNVDANDESYQVIKIDGYLEKQQERLMKLRDKERQKLVAYAKQLGTLHEEMNQKMKEMQNYENSLKTERKQFDYFGKSVCCCEKVSREVTIESVGSREVSTQCYQEWLDSNVANPRVMRVMEENLELNAILRQQNSRIDFLTKRVADLMLNQAEPVTRLVHDPKFATRSGFGGFVGTLRPEIENRTLASSVRRARFEINNLKDEKDSADLHYERILHNKLCRN